MSEKEKQKLKTYQKNRDLNEMSLLKKNLYFFYIFLMYNIKCVKQS